MQFSRSLLASALVLALAACGEAPAPEAPAPAPAAVPAEAAPEAAPIVEEQPAEAAPAAAASAKPAVVADCATTIEGNDAMQYNADSITIPASCSQFTIELKHVGSLAANVMGHNVVVAKAADVSGIAADGMSAAPSFIKPDDARVIAHTDMIGGGGSTKVTFDVAKVKDAGDVAFFCSFPGHAGMMRGAINIQ